MKTIKSFLNGRMAFAIVALYFSPLVAFPQAEQEVNQAANPRPEHTDAASTQIIKNYLTVTGSEQAHLALYNVVAKGKIKESTLIRNFTLVETLDGKRHLTYDWTHLGRKNRVVYAFDGLEAWTQVLEPQKQEAQTYGGSEGVHFSNNRWLLHPFILPTRAHYVFKYQGGARVGGRPTHVVKGFGKNNAPSWFYFDKEKFLLLRWGGVGQIAGTKEHMDYRANQFKSVSGVMLPTQIDLLAENAAFGHITFDRIQANQDLNDLSFLMPKSMIPTLRQRPVSTN